MQNPSVFKIEWDLSEFADANFYTRRALHNTEKLMFQTDEEGNIKVGS